MVNRFATIFGLAVLSVTAFGQASATGDLIDKARESGNFTTFLRLSDSIGLTPSFRTAGPDDKGYTLLAPTDAAFKKVPKWQMDALEADREMLRRVLRNHLIVGKDMFSDQKDSSMASLSGDTLRIQSAGTASRPDISVNGVRLSGSPMVASNGTLYAVDMVIIPAAVKDMLANKTALSVRTGDDGTATTDTTSADGNVLAQAVGSSYSTFTDLMDKSGLTRDYINKGPFTILVPSNAAFAMLPKDAVDAIMADPALIKDVLLYHILSGDRPSNVLRKGIVSSVNGIDLMVRVGPKGEMKFNQAVAVNTDIRTQNVVAYTINRVLLPRVVIDALLAKGIRIPGK